MTDGAHSSFPLLSSPIRLARLEVANRTVMSAMSSVLGDEHGMVTPEILGYYGARAEGGTGLIVVEFTCVDRRFGRAETNQLVLDTDEAIAGHAKLAALIKASGARAAIQLHLPGQHADRRTLRGLPSGPSPEVSRRDGVTPLSREFTSDEIEALIAAFGAAARRAVMAGYEAIEIHGAHGYLPMAFLSPLKNRRDDYWGGDEARRRRFAEHVIGAVKAALGPERPLVYRLSSSDFLKGGLDLPDMVRIVPHLVAAGADAIHVSSGVIEGTLDRAVDPMSADEGWRFAHCRAIRAVAGVPVIGVGPARWPATVEAALAAGDIDMVALGRPLLADPDWTRKAISGRVGDIRPCTNCNWCFERVLQHHPIGCAENPLAGAETTARKPEGGAGRRAIVVGAGPGGMAAALDLDDAGFDTHLFEIRNSLGGGLIASATPPLKDKLFWYLDHLKARLAASGVTVTLGDAMTGERILARKPDLIILATGAHVSDLPVEGLARPEVISAYDLLMGDVSLPEPKAGTVLVYGGGETGCETAELLASRGYTVTLVTRSPAQQLARSAETMYRKQLRARLAANPSITIKDNTTLVAIDDGIARLRGPNGPVDEVISRIVIAQGRNPGTPLADELSRAQVPFALIGDVRSIGRIGDAVHAARRAVLELTARAHSSTGRSVQ